MGLKAHDSPNLSLSWMSESGNMIGRRYRLSSFGVNLGPAVFLLPIYVHVFLPYHPISLAYFFSFTNMAYDLTNEILTTELSNRLIFLLKLQYNLKYIMGIVWDTPSQVPPSYSYNSFKLFFLKFFSFK